MAVQIGMVVAGKYRIDRLLGQGGMGTVYVAENQRLHKEVAFKVLSEAAVASADATERFMREAIAASRVKHPGIVEIYDADVHEGQPWIAMELLHGESLGERLERGPLSMEESLDIVAETLSVLEPVHRAGIVHRDLKPDNLFLDIQGDGRRVVKILDFGIAKIHGGELGSSTRTGMAMGTPFFLAPEQARNAKETDARADIYAAGVILYYVLSGALPYQAESFGDLVAQMFTQGPRSLAAVAPAAPPALCSIVDRCLSVQRDQRPESAAAFHAELRAFQSRVRAPAPVAVASTMPLSESPARLPTAPMHQSNAPYVPPAVTRPSAAGRWVVPGLGVAVLGLAVALGVVLLRNPTPSLEQGPTPIAGSEANAAVAAPRPPEVSEPEPAPEAEAAPEPEPEPEPEPAPAPAPAPHRPRTRRIAPAAERPAAPARTTPSPAPASDPAAVARRCMSQGDNACVVRTLEGRVHSPTELGLLISAYRALGRSSQAQRHMRTFVQRYPQHARASRYRQILGRSGPAPASAGSNTAPSNPF